MNSLTNYYIHPLSDVNSKDIGVNTKIWQFCVVCKGAIIGENSNIGAFCFIENNAKVGDNCTIKNGVQIWNGIEIKNNAFIGPNVVFTNDKYPKSRRGESVKKTFLHTVVEENVVIGAGSIILPGLTIGKNTFIAAGSLVTKNVPENTNVLGKY